MSTITDPPAPVDLNRPDSVPEIYSSGAIRVRNLTDTAEDCDFAGKLYVEAFRDKFVHATSEGSLQTVMVYEGKKMRGKPPLFYQREFLAEYDGERAGTIVLRYNGDNFPESDETPPIGCMDSCGLCCLTGAMYQDVSAGKCYVDHICVDAKFRGKGIGKVLLDVAERDARQKGCGVIFLWVASTNRAQNLYERQGYVKKESGTLCGCGMWCMTGIRKFYRMEKPL